MFMENEKCNQIQKSFPTLGKESLVSAILEIRKGKLES